MTKSHGVMGALGKLGLVEDEMPPIPHEDAPPPPPPAPIYVAPTGTATLTADDQAALKSIEAQVYAAPSSYVIFRQVSQSLNNPPDPQKVFDILAVANPSVTRAKVLADIDMHLGIVASTHQDFENQCQAKRSSSIDGPAQQIASLQQANQQATQDIAARTGQIASLQQTVAAAQRSLDAGEQRFKLIEDHLTAPLLQAKQLLGGK